MSLIDFGPYYIKNKLLRLYQLFQLRALISPRYLVIISGIDGSGKTTLALMLYKTFNKYGIKAKRLWRRQPFLLSLAILALIKILAHITSKSKMCIYIRCPLILKVLSFTMLYDMILYHVLDYLRYRFNSHIQIIIFDRHYLDCFVDFLSLIKLANLEYKHFRWIFKLLFVFLFGRYRAGSKNSIRLLLDANINVILRRRLEENTREVIIKKAIFKVLSHLYSFNYLDVSHMSKQEMFMAALGSVMHNMSGPSVLKAVIKLNLMGLYLSQIDIIKIYRIRILWELLKLLPWNIIKAFKNYIFHLRNIHSKISYHDFINLTRKWFRRMGIEANICAGGSLLRGDLKLWSDLDLIVVSKIRNNKVFFLINELKKRIRPLEIELFEISDIHEMINKNPAYYMKLISLSCIELNNETLQDDPDVRYLIEIFRILE